MQIKTPLQITPFLEKILCDFAGLSYPPKASGKNIQQVAKTVKIISNNYIQGITDKSKGIFTKNHFTQAYVSYYIPVNLVKLYPIMDELLRCRNKPLADKVFTMLDLGCGPGTFILGFLEYLVKKHPLIISNPETIHITGIDKVSDNISTAKELIKTYLKHCPLPSKPNWKLQFLQGSFPAENLSRLLIPRGIKFDLIVAGNIITELNCKNFPVAAKFLKSLLSPNGTIIVIDPGTKQSSKNLFLLKEAIQKNTSLNLYAPCPGTGSCPIATKEKNWCHEKIYWNPPSLIKAIDARTGFTKTKGLKYSYFTFTKKKLSVSQTCPGIPPGKIWRAVSYLIINKGEERLCVCNGRNRLLLRRLLKNTSETNSGFSNARRGDLLFFDGFTKRTDFLDITKDSRFQIL